MANTEVGSAYVSIIPSMKGFAREVQSGVKSAFSGIAEAAGIVALGAAITDIGKRSVSAFSDFQQMTGGVEKIFGDAAGMVEDYAAQAYHTAGVSQNEYMQQVTSFSQALKQSLGGDVVQAAEKANMAMIDMSDNANIFGSNIEDIQNAYQGFAKQNYTMLDNLKLGYGGTKSEMERLIADANKWEQANGRAGNLTIEKFSDVVQAIHDIQVQQGIAGDTAEEAAHTVAGSWQQVKASFENFLTALGSGQNLNTATQQMLESIKIFGENVIPVVGQIVSSIFEALPELLSGIGEVIEPALADGLSAAWNTAVQGLSTLGIDLPTIDTQTVQDAFNVIGYAIERVKDIAQPFVENVGQGVADILDALGQSAGDSAPLLDTFASAMQGISEAVSPVIGSALHLIADAIRGISDALNTPIGTGIITAVATLAGLNAVVPVIASVVTSLATFATAAVNIIKMTQSFIGLKAIILTLTGGPIPLIIAGIAAVVAGLIALYNTNEDFRNGVNAVANAIVNFVTNIPAAVSDTFSAIGDFFAGIPDAMLSALSTVSEMVNTAISDIAAFIASNPIAQSLSVAAQGVISIVQGAVSIVIGIVQTVGGLIMGIFTGDFSMLVTGVQGIIDGITSLISGAVDVIDGLFGAAASTIVSIVQTIGPAIVAIFTGIISFVSTVPGQIAGFFAGIGSWIAGFFAGIPGAVLGFFSATVSAVSGVPGQIAGFFAGIGSWIAGFFADIPGAVGGIMNDVINTVAGIPGQIVDYFAGLGARISSAFGSIHFPQPHIFFEDLQVGPASIPIPHVDWYATGGLFGAGNPSLIGVGDNRRYSEAVLPLSPSVLSGIGEGIVGQIGSGRAAPVYNVYINGEFNGSSTVRRITGSYLEELIEAGNLNNV